MPPFLRRIAFFAGGMALVAAARAVVGGAGAAAIAGTLLAAYATVGILLPRAAHRAFGRGNFGRAALLYGALARVRLSRAARGALQVSVAATLIGRDRHTDALSLLERTDRACLEESALAAWHNNRGYAMVRADRDPAEALAEIDAAVALRPDPVGFRHTRGLALLALGRLDEAIRELDMVWRDRGTGDTPPLLEAERCHDLGLAWERKGEGAYAVDYFERACRAAPGSIWAERAATRLGPASAMPAAFADLV